jgi:hypothetical protein
MYHAHGSTGSRGMSILIRPRLEYEMLNTHSTNDGRTPLINIQIDDCMYTLVNVYAPNDEIARRTYFKTVGKLIDEHGLGPTLLSGDFNEVICPTTDRLSKWAYPS